MGLAGMETASIPALTIRPFLTAVGYNIGMPIQPDTKDWTWVLERRCDECGFEAPAFPREEVGAMVRANAAQ